MIEVADALHDGELAAEAAALLEPYANRPIMASLAVVCFGSAAYALGRAATVTGNVGAAEQQLRAAVAANERLGHVPAVAAAEDRLRALTRRSAHRRPIVVTVQRTGSGWWIGRDEEGVTVPDSVGAQYLSVLLRRPGDAISALDLASGGLQPATSSAEVLDATARQSYVRRAHDLQTALEDALACGDQQREFEARTELDWLADELARDTGLGGRSRRFPGEAERARTSVQKAIRRVLQQVARQDEELGRLLGSHLVTGLHCSYQPER